MFSSRDQLEIVDMSVAVFDCVRPIGRLAVRVAVGTGGAPWRPLSQAAALDAVSGADVAVADAAPGAWCVAGGARGEEGECGSGGEEGGGGGGGHEGARHAAAARQQQLAEDVRGDAGGGEGDQEEGAAGRPHRRRDVTRDARRVTRDGGRRRRLVTDDDRGDGPEVERGGAAGLGGGVERGEGVGQRVGVGDGGQDGARRVHARVLQLVLQRRDVHWPLAHVVVVRAAAAAAAARHRAVQAKPAADVRHRVAAAGTDLAHFQPHLLVEFVVVDVVVVGVDVGRRFVVRLERWGGGGCRRQQHCLCVLGRRVIRPVVFFARVDAVERTAGRAGVAHHSDDHRRADDDAEKHGCNERRDWSARRRDDARRADGVVDRHVEVGGSVRGGRRPEQPRREDERRRGVLGAAAAGGEQPHAQHPAHQRQVEQRARHQTRGAT